ncbi:MAG: hypothetical protein ACOYVK_18825 [Bacillota bacterium]
MIIQGYFENMKKAKETVNALKEAGFKNAQFDINDHYISDRNVNINGVGTETAPSLSGLVLKSGPYAIEEIRGSLLAADPAVSGMGKINEIADINCKVIVEVDDANIKTVKDILVSMGADLENPYIEKPIE